MSQGIVFITYKRSTSTKFRLKHSPIVEIFLALSKGFCTNCSHSSKIVAEVRFEENYKTRSKKIGTLKKLELLIHILLTNLLYILLEIS